MSLDLPESLQTLTQMLARLRSHGHQREPQLAGWLSHHRHGSLHGHGIGLDEQGIHHIQGAEVDVLAVL